MQILTSRQSILIMLITVLATKFFVLPINLTEGMQQNTVIISLIYILIEYLLIFILLKYAIKNENLTFYELLEKSFGMIYAKVIFVLLFLFYLGKLVLNVSETYAFFLNTLYENISPLTYIIPLAILLIFAFIKGLTAIGRTAEILWAFIIFGIIFSIIISSQNVDLSNLLPFMAYPLDESLDTLQTNLFWFGDFFTFLMFFGNIKFNKHYIKNMFIALFSALLIFATFILIYFCLFPYTSGFNHFAVSDITQFVPSVASFGRIDWITSFIWTVASIFQSIIYYYCTVKALENIVKIKSIFINIFSSILLIVCLYLLNFNLTSTITFAQGPIRFLVLILIFAGYILMPIHSAIVERRKNENKNTNSN